MSEIRSFDNVLEVMGAKDTRPLQLDPENSKRDNLLIGVQVKLPI